MVRLGALQFLLDALSGTNGGGGGHGDGSTAPQPSRTAGLALLKESLGWGKLLRCTQLGGCLLVSDALNLESWNANLIAWLPASWLGCSTRFSLMGRSASQRGINPWTTMVYIFGFDAIFLLAFNVLPIAGIPGSSQGMQNLIWSSMDWIGWAVLFILAAVPTLLGFGTYMISLSYLPSSVVNLLATLEPVFTAILAYLCFAEKLNLIQLAGAVLILGGVIVIRLTEGLRKNNATSTPVPDEK